MSLFQSCAAPRVANRFVIAALSMWVLVACGGRRTLEVHLGAPLVVSANASLGFEIEAEPNPTDGILDWRQLPVQDFDEVRVLREQQQVFATGRARAFVRFRAKDNVIEQVTVIREPREGIPVADASAAFVRFVDELVAAGWVVYHEAPPMVWDRCGESLFMCELSRLRHPAGVDLKPLCDCHNDPATPTAALSWLRFELTPETADPTL